MYKRGVKERFPDGGKGSQQLDEMKIGDTIEMRGPFGMVEYKGRGVLVHGPRKTALHVKQIGMIAGGTGITPMLQVLESILRDDHDETRVSLLFANQTEDDILLRKRLEELRKMHPQRFVSLHYTLDRAPQSGWAYSEGFIDANMIQAHLPKASDDTAILCCGPPPMIKYACRPNLEKLGHEKRSVVVF